MDKQKKIEELVKLSKRNRSFKSMTKSVLKHTALITVAISMLLPFFWMISTSLKTTTNVFVVPPQWIPNPMQPANYKNVFEAVPFLRYIINTTLYTLSNTFLEVFVSIIVAFGFARYNFKYKKSLFMFLLITIMMPGEITLVPGYIFWAKLGEFFNTSFIDTYVPLVLPAIGGQAVHIFFLFQYFRTIPKDFSEAAYINGANSWKILWRVYAPMSIPAIITIGISSLMGTWNAFLSPLIYLNDSKKFTIQVGLAMFRGLFEVNWPLLMAATTISIIPMILLFFSAQKYFIPSTKSDAIK